MSKSHSECIIFRCFFRTLLKSQKYIIITQMVGKQFLVEKKNCVTHSLSGPSVHSYSKKLQKKLWLLCLTWWTTNDFHIDRTKEKQLSRMSNLLDWLANNTASISILAWISINNNNNRKPHNSKLYRILLLVMVALKDRIAEQFSAMLDDCRSSFCLSMLAVALKLFFVSSLVHLHNRKSSERKN